MFLIIEAKVSEVFKMIYTTSEDEQLLQKIVVGMADYLHVTRYFDLKTNFTSLIQYLCEACPSLITLTMTHPTTPQAVVPLADGDTVSSIHSWKCLHLLQFLLQSVAEYATSLEQVGARGRNDVQEWNYVVDLLFWLDAHSLLPASPTLLDLASEHNTLFPTMKGVCTTKPSGDRGLWNALSSLFGGEADTLSEELKTAIQEVIQEANIEDFFLKSNRMKVNAWIVLFKALLSNDHVHPSASIASLSSLFMLKLHWMVLLLSKNTDRIGMVWGLVISFLERVRTMAMEKVAAKGGSER